MECHVCSLCLLLLRSTRHQKKNDEYVEDIYMLSRLHFAVWYSSYSGVICISGICTISALHLSVSVELHAMVKDEDSREERSSDGETKTYQGSEAGSGSGESSSGSDDLLSGSGSGSGEEEENSSGAPTDSDVVSDEKESDDDDEVQQQYVCV